MNRSASRLLTSLTNKSYRCFNVVLANQLNTTTDSLMKLHENFSKQQYSEVVRIYESLLGGCVSDTIANDDALKLAIISYGAISKPAKSRLLASQLVDKKRSAEFATVVINIYSRCDRLHSAESILFSWLDLIISNKAAEISKSSKNLTLNGEGSIIFNELITIRSILNNRNKKDPHISTSIIPEAGATINSSILLLDENGFDKSVLANTLPGFDCWEAMARLYAGRQASSHCLAILNYMEIHRNILENLSSSTSTDFDVFYHHVMRTICATGGTGKRNKIKDLLERRNRHLSTTTSDPIGPITLQHMIRHLPLLSYSSSPSSPLEGSTTFPESDTWFAYLRQCTSESPDNLPGIRGTVSAILSRLCNGGKLDDALSLLSRLEHELPNAYGSDAVDIVIHSLCTSNRSVEALVLYQKNYQREDTGAGGGGSVTIHHVADALRKTGNLKEMTELLMAHS